MHGIEQEVDNVLGTELEFSVLFIIIPFTAAVGTVSAEIMP